LVTRRRTTFLTLLASGLLGAWGLASCSEARPGAGGDGEGNGSANYCAVRNEGCPCDQPGLSAACGTVTQRSGDFVMCSEGNQVCQGGTWSACVGDHITTKYAPLASGVSELRTMGLADAAGACPNPCAPDCQQFADNPVGLTPGADSGLVVVDGGLTITGTVVTGPPCTSLTVTPNASPGKDLIINTGMAPPNPGSRLFTATLGPAGCYTGPTPALWSVDKFDIAQVVNGNMTMATPIAGPVTVSAYAGSLSASVVSNVTVNVVDVSAAPATYDNTDFPVTTGTADGNFQFLYPYDATLFPLGLAPPLIMWRDTTNPTVPAVKVTLRYPPAPAAAIFSWSKIIPEKQVAPTPGIAARPRAEIPANVWFAFEQTVTRNAGTLGDTAQLAVQRYIGAAARAEVTRSLRFANGSLKGRILYNSYGTNLVQNYGNTRWGTRFGAATLQIDPGAAAPTVVAGTTTASNGTGCRVCHSVNANGTTLVTNRFDPNNQTSSKYNLSTLGETLLGASPGIARFSWAGLSVDGTTAFTNAGPTNLDGTSGTLYSGLYSTVTGNAVAGVTQPATLRAATPAFAHDMSAVAFNFYAGVSGPLPNPPSGPLAGDGKSLASMAFNPATNVFSNFRNLYVAPGTGPGTGTASWPSYLPPGQNGIVFHREIRYNTHDFAGTRADCDGTGTCNNTGTTAELWWVNTVGASQPRRLDRLNGWNGATSYLPTDANLHGNPVDATYSDNVYNYEPTVLPTLAGGYSWVVFTSRRLYGNVATINPFWSDPRYQYLNVEPTPKKLWIAPISQNPTAGADPSFPAIYLPGQELLAGNSRGYFVLEACKAPGLPTPSNVCETTSDCCQSPTASVCQIDPPPLANPPVRHCVASGGAGCKADGLACVSDAECCNFPTGVRCASGVCQAPPPIASFGNPSFVRTFVGDCPPSKRVKWRFFDWITTTPVGTSIDFSARTSELTGAWGASVPIGQAIAPPVTTPTWTSAAQTVDVLLKNAGQSSKPRLEVTMVFNPKTTAPTAAPILTNWRMAFDCESAE